jgi:hypothetical protein
VQKIYGLGQNYVPQDQNQKPPSQLGHSFFEFYMSGYNHQGNERDEIVENISRVRKVFYVKPQESDQDKCEGRVQNFYIITLSFPIPKDEKNQRDHHKLSYENPQLFSHPTDPDFG